LRGSYDRCSGYRRGRGCQMRGCGNCGEDLSARHGLVKYCDPLCRDAAERGRQRKKKMAEMLRPITCAQCAKDFTPIWQRGISKDRKFCSNKCLRENKMNPDLQIEACLQCGGAVKDRQRNVKFCSYACGGAYRHQKNKTNCTDVYVRGLLRSGSDLRSSDLPVALVRLKRAQITLNREVQKHD
jgi:hypothetical protein